MMEKMTATMLMIIARTRQKFCHSCNQISRQLFFFPCTALKTIFFLPCTLDTETILFCLVLHWKLFLLLPCIPLKTNLIISQDEILNNSTIYPNVVTDLNSESHNKQTLRQYFFLTTGTQKVISPFCFSFSTFSFTHTSYWGF